MAGQVVGQMVEHMVGQMVERMAVQMVERMVGRMAVDHVTIAMLNGTSTIWQ